MNYELVIMERLCRESLENHPPQFATAASSPTDFDHVKHMQMRHMDMTVLNNQLVQIGYV